MGGANVIGNLQLTTQRKIASDILRPVIDFYHCFQTNPLKIIELYRAHWVQHQLDKGHFYAVRKQFNLTHDPCDFFFLARTSHNGLIRFNKNGEFNAPVHHQRRGVNPESLNGLFSDWLVRLSDVEFRCSDYKAILAECTAGDLCYFDPPYVSTNAVYGCQMFSMDEFAFELSVLNSRGVNWMCSYYECGAEQLDAVAIQKHIIPSGQSSFRKMHKHGIVRINEALYTNYVSSQSNQLPNL